MQDNPRIVRQDGSFLLFGANKQKNIPAEVPHNYMYKPKGLRLIIRSAEKNRMREQLEALGVSEGKIYPEIDSVALYVKSTFEIKDNKKIQRTKKTRR
jgi:hypothetical protein